MLPKKELRDIIPFPLSFPSWLAIVDDDDGAGGEKAERADLDAAPYAS